MRKLLIACAGAALLAASAVSAYAYTGSWSYHDHPNYSENLRLGDSSDGTYRQFYGTREYCGRPGAPYASMRRVLRESNQGNGRVDWYIDRDCGYVVRVCISNQFGSWACSSYQDGGWD